MRRRAGAVRGVERSHLPALRNRAFRGRTVSAPRRRGGRGGAITRAAADVASRLRDIRALWFAVHNDPKYSVMDLSSEFYYAVGEILEGHPVRGLNLRKIDRDRVSQHAEE